MDEKYPPNYRIERWIKVLREMFAYKASCPVEVTVLLMDKDGNLSGTDKYKFRIYAN